MTRCREIKSTHPADSLLCSREQSKQALEKRVEAEQDVQLRYGDTVANDACLGEAGERLVLTAHELTKVASIFARSHPLRVVSSNSLKRSELANMFQTRMPGFAKGAWIGRGSSLQPECFVEQLDVTTKHSVRTNFQL